MRTQWTCGERPTPRRRARASAFRPGSSAWPLALSILAPVASFLFLSGCATPGRVLSAREQAAAAAARPILEMDPDCVWTDRYNRLVELAPDSVSYLARHPIMHRRAAPDDLRVMLHTSLLRLLSNPSTAPCLSANCLETTLDMLHFDLKVRGHRIGSTFMPAQQAPTTWHSLYPADFDHRLAAEIDVDGDRRVLRNWWLAHNGQPELLATRRRLAPQPDQLWRLLTRRYADEWLWEPACGALLCDGAPQQPGLMRGMTYDYNLVRAACVWLGARTEQDVQRRLIELIGHRSPVVAHNARFALGFSRQPRIRAVVEQYRDARQRDQTTREGDVPREEPLKL
ncbi:MAG: hypothetical protein KKB50_10875 [Planctomycetes bacterium]|nr:hypothetical protein [Planctomycetota bacterium]